jgi:hypothetical protein
MKLDEENRPGLPRAEFKGLWATCIECGFVTTRRVFKKHECPVAHQAVVIDLTGDTDSEVNEN